MAWRLPADDPLGRTGLQRLLTAQDLSERLQVPRRTVYEYVQIRGLPCVRCGPRLLRFREDDVLRWLEDNQDASW